MKKYIIDIDGTICTNTNGKYEDAIPFHERINKINKLYDEGNYIIYYTARGMTTYKENIDDVYKRWFLWTEHQLKKWNVKYHELKLGKMVYDFWIDDKGENADEFFKTIP